MEVLGSAGPELNIPNKSDDEATELKNNIKINNVAPDENSDSSDEEKLRVKSKRVQRLSDSDSSQNVDDSPTLKTSPSPAITTQNCSSDDEQTHTTYTQQRSRIRSLSSGSDSDNLPDSTTKSRIQKKQIKLQNKFKTLHNRIKNHVDDTKRDVSCSSADSDNDLNSVENIKQILKERNQYLKSTLYDPDTDTSDEESTQNHQEKITKMKKERKSAKLISPKPMRMTAKDAMENMQKIKSESNRLLREKEVSLPYHRPKALSLKDIMSKRRPAVTADGKALPIKMNEEQLKHYVKILEERQKEVIQLCKSDTEEEDEDPQSEKQDTDTGKDENESGMVVEADSENINKTLEITSDNLYDDLKSNLEESTSETQDSNNKVINNKTNKEAHQTDEIVIDNTKNEQIQPVLTETLPNTDQTLIDNTKNDQRKPELTDTPLNTDQIVSNNTKNDQIQSEDTQINTESESQFVLHYTEDSEVVNKLVPDQITLESKVSDDSKGIEDQEVIPPVIEENDKEEDAFSDADIDMEYIDSIIENADIIKDGSAPALSENPLNVKPKLTGAPGTVVDLDDIDATTPKNLTGVELLKERYIFFSKLKTPEEIERDKEKRIKPGTLHLKLKHELEEKMAEQRSLEWSKRLEEEKAQHMETDGAEDQEEDDIEKLEAKLEEDAEVNDAEDAESEKEMVEDDCDMEDKPRKRNPMLDDEAEVSDEDEGVALDENVEQTEEDDNAEADNESEESSDESSESEDEQEQSKPKKGRILKAFEDSDEEDDKQKEIITGGEDNLKITENISPVLNKNSQDDELQLAQVQRSYSEDLFPSQSSGKTINDKNTTKATTTEVIDDKIEDTQSFSIMESNKDIVPLDDNFSMTCDSQDDKIEPEVVELLGNLPQNLEQSQLPIAQSQGFGDDVLALCTGNFYDNKFVSQIDIQKDSHVIKEIENTKSDTIVEPQPKEPVAVPNQKIESCDILKSILGELDSPEFEKPKKFFTGNNQSQKEEENSVKKKFVIDSDDEASETVAIKKIKKKKKRMENRALQISDDEEESEDDEPESEIDDDEDKEEKIIEYDSEENEVITSYNPIKPKKKTVTDFFEDEAELSSNEEWSGDEDERGLDRMEKEEGDQDHFHQGKLQKELGIIHMREVLDQDKREVRMIQELLFEDGDLGDGHRQRRFRWKNIDGVEVDFTTMQSLNPSQDDEFEMEEQWRKERHEREVFLKKMRENSKNEDEINEIPILDENLTMNMTTVTANKDAQPEKRAIKDIPSPRKPLGLFQSNYRGSLLSRGGSSLSRLAALAGPLVDSENTTTVAAGSRNFVFATLSQSDQPKVPKRKANNEGTPRLMKKLKSEQNTLRNSLLDHLNQ